MRFRLTSNASERQVVKHVDSEGTPCADIILPMRGDPDLEVTAEEYKLLESSTDFRADERAGVYLVEGIPDE